MYCFMHILLRQPSGVSGRVLWYPVALEAFLIAKINIMDVEREAFRTLQGASGFFTAGAFA